MLIFQIPEKVIQNDSILHKPRGNITAHMIEAFYVIPQLSWLGFDYSQRKDLDAINMFIKKMVNK